MPEPDEVEIVPYPDGPYLVRGPVVVRDQEGRDVPLARQPVALCRCGKSRMRPFCDGTHQLIGFSAPSPPEQPFPAVSAEPRARRPVDPSLRDAAALIRSALGALEDAGGDGDDGAALGEAMAGLRTAARVLERRL